MPKPRYEFRKITRADYPMLRRWLAEPHIDGWWGTSDAEIALIEQDIDTGPTDMRIVSLDGHPFAYVQDGEIRHWFAPHYADYPGTSSSVDTFIGEPDYLGRGHAGSYLRQRAEELLSNGAAHVLIDPSPENRRALRAYRAAGFQDIAIRPCEDGTPVIVMEFRPDPLKVLP